MIGSMHGNEPGGVPAAKRLEKLGAPNGTAMWVIRNLNPDGARSNTRQNANKVDLNRNGTYLWQAKGISREYYPLALHRHQSRRQRPTFRSSNRSSPTLCSSTTSTETVLIATGRRMRA